MPIDQMKRERFAKLFHEFVSEYGSKPKGHQHLAAYESCRTQGHDNFAGIAATADQGKDITDQVLLRLLPYTDSAANREKGAWVHVAPCVTGDLKGWFENAGWTKPDDWPIIATAILGFVRRCNDHPEQLESACAEFATLSYSKGFQAGMLSPILNALRPADFVIINNKSRRVINYFAGTSDGQSLIEYPTANRCGKELVQELAETIHLPDVPDQRDSDLFDMFSHWLVAVKKYDFGSTRYWKIAPGENGWQWEECRTGGFIAVGWDEFGDISGLSRDEFEKLRDKLIAEHSWTKGADQVWTLRAIRINDTASIAIIDGSCGFVF